MFRSQGSFDTEGKLRAEAFGIGCYHVPVTAGYDTNIEFCRQPGPKGCIGLPGSVVLFRFQQCDFSGITTRAVETLSPARSIERCLYYFGQSGSGGD